MDSRRIIRTYLGIGATTTLAQSLIWGVNTLFLLDVGLDIFEIMVVNAAFTVSQMFFEVPTGVIADTLGRRASYLLSVGDHLAVDAALRVVREHRRRAPSRSPSPRSILGVGFTFYTGAVDAWMVDALGAVGYEGKLDPIFARYGMTFGVFMLIGTISGGFLGQIGLWVPYVARAAVLVPAFLLGLLLMRDLGFRGRPLRLATFGGETRRIARAGITFGLRDRVVRFVMFASLVQGLFLMYGFYSWQRYFLDLLGRDLVWVTGVIAGLVGPHADLRQRARRAAGAAHRRSRRDPHGRGRGIDRGRRRRRPHPGVLGRGPALPRLGAGLGGVHPGQAGVDQRPHPFERAGDDHLARRALRRRGQHRRAARAGLRVDGGLDPRGVARRRAGAGARPAAAGGGATGAGCR